MTSEYSAAVEDHNDLAFTCCHKNSQMKRKRHIGNRLYEEDGAYCQEEISENPIQLQVNIFYDGQEAEHIASMSRRLK